MNKRVVFGRLLCFSLVVLLLSFFSSSRYPRSSHFFVSCFLFLFQLSGYVGDARCRLFAPAL